MTHNIEVALGILGLIAFFIYYRWDMKIQFKITAAELIIINSDKYDSSSVHRLFREEREAIYAVAKNRNRDARAVAYWVRTRLLD